MLSQVGQTHQHGKGALDPADKFAEVELPRSTRAAINAALVNEGQMSANSAAAISGTSDKTAAKDAAKARESTSEDSEVAGPRLQGPGVGG
jgi:hypothetical protein